MSMRPVACDLEQLQDHFDGRLDAAASAAVMAHVQACPECDEALSAWGAMRRAVAELPVADTAHVLAWPGIARRVDRRHDTAAGWLRAGCVAAGLAIVLALWQLLSVPPAGRLSAAGAWDELALQSSDARQQWMLSNLPLPEDQFGGAPPKEARP
ncbi:MAG: zf-HC2 domain-containing protein [Candidatus Eisenbacteria bacterium]|nr:zf-HC2 domain-containing protein [Candidatus Eisenbacteria bacterium]